MTFNFKLAGISCCKTSYTMGEFYQLYLPMILLMSAGDIETNPGPISPESHINELEIVQLLKEINPTFYQSLGTSLGIKMEHLPDNHDAFLDVLMDWNADQQHQDIDKRELLADSLERIGLEDLQDKLRSGSLVQTAPYTPDLSESTVDPLSPELVERCRKDFMLKYETTLCRIRSDPLNPDSLVQLQEIYTNLILEEEHGRGRRNLDIDGLLKIEVNGSKPKRFLIQGEAGAGKTTLCAKIAWDWINGTHYQQFAWLLIVPLRESEDYTMGEIAKSYLQEDNPTTAAQLTHYIRSNPDNVLTVYDGLDEFRAKLQKKRRNETNNDALTRESGKYRPTRRAGDDTRQKYSRQPGPHTQKASFDTHPDGFNKESGAQQTHEKAKQQSDERQELGGVTHQPGRFTKNTSGDFTQMTVDYTEQADDSEASKQSKDYSGGQSVHSHQQIDFSELTGPSTVLSDLHTKNPLGYTPHHDPKYHYCELIIEDIICCNQLNRSVVLITTRPWKAREIKEDTDIRDGYAFIRVDGFTEENMSSYIHKYFAKDESRASDLIEFINDSDVLSENMARYPIFVAMLCLMWKEIRVEKKETIKSLQTYSQFFREMFMFLKEHYVQKITDDLSPSSLNRLVNETSVLLKPIAELAFTGLLENTLIFDERHFHDCQDSKTAACRVGVLSQENRIAPVVGREEQKPHAQGAVFFPHKLFQEYMAGVHLASLHDSDHKGYTKLMKEVVLPRKEDFRYLLYFTASQNKNVGISVMTHMVQEFKERTHFLVDVALECNDQDAVAVVQRSTTPKMDTLEIKDRVTSHTVAGYASVEVNDVVNLRIGRECGKTVSRDVGRIISSSPSLSELTMYSSNMHDGFYAFLAKESQNIKITKLYLEDIPNNEGYKELSSSASRDLAEALCSMPHLNDLTLKRTYPHDDFYSVLKVKASHIKITELYLKDIPNNEGYKELSSSASRDLAEALCSMPHLNDLTLKNTHPHGDFYSVMKEKASHIKITKLYLEDITDNGGWEELSSSASRDLAEALCSMPHLNDLTLKNTHPRDDFYSVMKETASCIKITKLCLEDITDDDGWEELSSSASRDLAEALCSMPHMNDLTLKNTHPRDDFYSVMKDKASYIKITKLCLEDIPDDGGWEELSSSSSRDLAEALCSMPHLNDLTLNNTHPNDDFYSVMKEKASHIKITKLCVLALPDYRGSMELSSSASGDLAEALCSMPHLNDLTLNNTRPHDDFYSVMKEKASHIKITTLCVLALSDYRGSMELSSSASRDLAEALGSMPHLNNLTLNNTFPHDEFSSVMKEKASHIKITTLCLENIPDYKGSKELSFSASRDLAEALCSMPHLTDLTLKNAHPHDEFYSVMKEKASRIKITKLYLPHIPDYNGSKELSSSASGDLAEALCSMPHLNDLTLKNTHPHDDFYSVLKEKASHIKITKLYLEDIPDYEGSKELSSSASRDLAEAFCSAPHLNDLTLKNTHPHDDFHSVMKEKASHIKITKLFLQDIPDYWASKELSSSASRDLAEALCSMPHLNDLTLNDTHPHDDFYSIMKENASHIKIATLCLEDIPNYRKDRELSSSASRDLAEALCCMPHLNDLTLNDTGPHDDFYSIIKQRASLAKECFPHVAEGLFRLNGVTQWDMHSLLNSFKILLWIESDDGGSYYSGEEADDRWKETDYRVEEEKCFIESVDEKKTDYGHAVDEESKTSHEDDETEDDPEERNPEQNEEKSDDVRDDEESTENMKGGNHVEGLFDHQGGELSLKTYGCILGIPPGALEEESPTKITLEVLTELPDDLELEEDEMVVSPGFKCLPSRLHFKKPVKLIMPHCAVLRDPGKVKTVLHSWSRQTRGKVERIQMTWATCKLYHSHFELSLEHFCKKVLTVNGPDVIGKVMCCMPYLPNTMPTNRKPLMELRLQNKPSQALKYTKGFFYQPALDEDDEIMIERKDLTVTCDHAEEGNDTKVITCSRLFHTTKCKAYFALDLRDIQDNTIVTLELTQTDAQEMMFSTSCIEEAPSQNQILHASPSSSTSCLKEDVSAKSEVSEKEFLALAKGIESSRYLEVGINLEIRHAELKDIKKGQSNRDALMDVFMKWRVKQALGTDFRSVLADKLEEVGLQELSGKLRNGTLGTS